MTTEFKISLLCAIVMGLALGAVLALLDQLPEPQVYIVTRPDIAPAEISAMHEEVRRIQREADGGTR